MIDSRIRYEESFADDYTGEITHYFVGDKTLLCELTGNAYPEADGMTLSITNPRSSNNPSEIIVSMSPYIDDGSSIIDYDWRDITVPEEDMHEFLLMIEKHNHNEKKPPCPSFLTLSSNTDIIKETNCVETVC